MDGKINLLPFSAVYEGYNGNPNKHYTGMCVHVCVCMCMYVCMHACMCVYNICSIGSNK